MSRTNTIVKYINNYSRIVKWSKKPLFHGYSKKMLNTLEKKWGNKMINSTDNNQWTTKLGENLVKDTLILNGEKVWKPKKINGYLPDLETNDYIYEVKTRNWTTSGTAGEKVLGVPYKYSDIPRLYKKPLRIVCVAYQEHELTFSNTKIFGKDISPEKLRILKFWKKMEIEFIPFSSLIK